MAAIRMVWVGKTQKGFVSDGVNHYTKRITPLCPLSLEEVRPADHSGRSASQSRALEAEGLLKRFNPGDLVVLLDEKGKQPDTRGFSHLLESWLNNAGKSVVFVVGGAFGVNEEVKARADYVLALSSLTLPHQLVRVVALEQIYRALSLLSGHPYHHD